MADPFARIPRRAARIGALACLTIALAGGVLSAGSGLAAGKGAGSGPLGCEIRQSASGGQILLEPVVTAASGGSGSYRMTLAGGGSGGSSTISQGGDFTALPGRATSLGEVSLGANGVYRARLEVTAGGLSAVCKAKVGGAL